MSEKTIKHPVPIEWYGPLFDWLQDKLALKIDNELYAAAQKHGVSQVPTNPDMTHGEFISILGEEFGEVCRAGNYDTGDLENYKSELVQLISMAAARLYSMEDK